jgi:hypothetical protein
LNQALIQHLESLPQEHLEVHLAAYPWFAAARVVLAKKSPSQQAVRQTIPYVSDRKWFKNYFQKSSLFQNPPEEETNKETTPHLAENESVAQETPIELANNQQPPTNIDQLLIETTNEKAANHQPLEEVKEEDNLSTTETTDFILQKEQSFSDWISQFSIAKTENSKTKNAHPKPLAEKHKNDELEMLIQSNIPYEMLENKIEAETQYSKGLSDFIAEQKRHKKQQLPTPNFDEKSRLPITETIAKLLENQGKIKQAIGIYEQLSLKFPQKSAYFAAHIQKLKEKI